MAQDEESALKTCICENLEESLAMREALCCCSFEILDPSLVSLHAWEASCKPSCPCPWLFSHHLTVLLSLPAWLICGFPSLFVTGKCWFAYLCLCGLMPAIYFQVNGWFSWINLGYIWLRASWGQAHGNQKVKMARRAIFVSVQDPEGCSELTGAPIL